MKCLVIGGAGFIGAYVVKALLAAGEEAVVYDLMLADNTLNKILTPEELAHFFVFLCSPLASYCVGSTYYVDGGWLKVV